MAVLAGIGLFLSAVGIAQQISASRQVGRVAEEQKETGAADRRLAEIRNRRAKVEELRKGRIARAQIISSAEGASTSKSSGALGGAAAVQSQTASNIGFLGQVEETSQNIFQRAQRISGLQSSIAQKQAFASVTGTLAQTFQPAVKELFK